jgi:hypothetical protein
VIDGITSELDDLYMDLSDLAGDSKKYAKGRSELYGTISGARDTVKRLRARLIMAQNASHGSQGG